MCGRRRSWSGVSGLRRGGGRPCRSFRGLGGCFPGRSADFVGGEGGEEFAGEVEGGFGGADVGGEAVGHVFPDMGDAVDDEAVEWEVRGVGFGGIGDVGMAGGGGGDGGEGPGEVGAGAGGAPVGYP